MWFSVVQLASLLAVVIADYKIRLQLHSFLNPSGQTAAGYCCDAPELTSCNCINCPDDYKCDMQFHIQLQLQCDDTEIFIYSFTGVVNSNADTLEFLNNVKYGSWENPFEKVCAGRYKGFGLAVDVSDGNYNVTDDQLIDTHNMSFDVQQAPPSSEDHVYQSTHSRHNASDTVLTFSYSVDCLDGFMGSHCETPTTSTSTTTTTTTTPTTTTTSTTSTTTPTTTSTSTTTTTTPTTTTTTPTTTTTTPTTTTTTPTTTTTTPTTTTTTPTTTTTTPTTTTTTSTTTTTTPTTTTTTPTTTTTTPTTTTTTPTTTTTTPTTTTTTPTTTTTTPTTTTTTSTTTTTMPTTTTTTPTTTTTSTTTTTTTKPPVFDDCAGYKQFNPANANGVYLLNNPNGDMNNPIRVFCDMETEGEAWIVIQRRFDGMVNFRRGFADYQNGFGEADTEYWLGLEVIRMLAGRGNTDIRFDIWDCLDKQSFAKYVEFKLGGVDDFYRLHIGDYNVSSTAGDSLNYVGTDSNMVQNGQQFTAQDSDHDQFSGNCASILGGGFWFNRCGAANPNGIYYPDCHYNSGYFDKGIQWRTWHQDSYSAKRFEIKIRKPTP